MARIRSIHPSLFTDEAWVSCSPLARILYVGLMCDADDQGLFEWKPLQIKMRLLPGDAADVTALLAEIIGAGLIAELTSGGKRLGAIRYFRRFQRPKKPNAIFVLPSEWRTYVGLDEADTEPANDDGGEVPNRFPPSPEKSPQMEDGGGKREDSVTTLSAPTDFPAVLCFENPTKASLDILEGLLRASADVAINVASPRLKNLAPVLGLLRPGAGPPCDLYADVLPTIEARGARAPPGSVKSWDYFRDAIAEARDRRLAGAPARDPANVQSPRSDAKFTARQANHAAAFAGSERAAGRRWKP